MDFPLTNVKQCCVRFYICLELSKEIALPQATIMEFPNMDELFFKVDDTKRSHFEGDYLHYFFVLYSGGIVTTAVREDTDMWEAICLEMELKRRYHRPNPRVYLAHQPWTEKRWFNWNETKRLTERGWRNIARLDKVVPKKDDRVTVKDGLQNPDQVRTYLRVLEELQNDPDTTKKILDELDLHLFKISREKLNPAEMPQHATLLEVQQSIKTLNEKNFGDMISDDLVNRPLPFFSYYVASRAHGSTNVSQNNNSAVDSGPSNNAGPSNTTDESGDITMQDAE
jgi:hypothetical protein